MVSFVALIKPWLITVVLDAPTPLFAATALLPLRIIDPVDEIFKISPTLQVNWALVATDIVVEQDALASLEKKRTNKIIPNYFVIKISFINY